MMRFIRLSDYTWWIWLSLACCLLAGLLVDPIYFFSRYPHLHHPSHGVLGSRKQRILFSFPTPSRIFASPCRALCASASISLLGSGHWHVGTLFLRVLSAGTLPFLATLEPYLAADFSGSRQDIQRSSQS